MLDLSHVGPLARSLSGLRLALEPGAQGSRVARMPSSTGFDARNAGAELISSSFCIVLACFQVRPNLVSLNTALRAAADRGFAWSRSLLGRLRRSRLTPDVVSYGSLMAEWTQGLAVLATMGCRPNVVCYTALATAWPRSVWVLELMGHGGVAGNVVTWSGAVASAPWPCSGQLLRAMEQQQVRPNVVTQGGLVAACPWVEGLAAASGANVVGRNSLLSACGRAAQWQRAVGVLRELPRPNVISFWADDVPFGLVA